MRVLIPTALRAYTQRSEVDAAGDTLEALVSELDRRYPGIRFRMIDEQDRVRPHIRFFVNGEQVGNLAERLGGTDEVVIVQALSGG